MEYLDSSSPATISNNQHYEMNTGLDSDDEVVDEIIRYLDPYVATHSPPDDGAANQVPRDKPGVAATSQQGGSPLRTGRCAQTPAFQLTRSKAARCGC
jgi:hypothetical protein